MKVVHICMVAYLDGWGYQDNLLPAYTSKAGHNVVVITPMDHFPVFLKEEERKKIQAKGTDYYDRDVHVYRIRTKLNTSNYTFYCRGIAEILNKERPDVIYHHGINSSSMMICWRYILKHPNVRFFVDNHADHINESPNKVWNAITTRGIMRLCVRLINRSVTKFYGVTPGRCDYLREVFGAAPDKISLFPIGGDTNATDTITASKGDLRTKYGVPNDTFIVVSGGKMGVDKGTVSLIQACERLKDNEREVSLVLFGRFTNEKTKSLAEETDRVYYQGWCGRNKTLELLKMSDLACWPIHHTTLIEDAIAASVPLVIRETSNTSHSIDGNGEFVQNGTEDELFNAIEKVLTNYSHYSEGAIKMHDKYSYVSLVKQFEKDCEKG